ncbi:MAG: transporter substrate-binding domain-containing protein [Ruminococcaceae bacterium]|nr:transporter substrate-binding domain-containing protein [Oscillospiraceae bacterium]
MNKLKAVLLICFVLVLLFSVPCFAIDSDIDWTEDEWAYLNSNPVVSLGVDPDFVPFEFIDEDGVYKGIAADYLELVSQKTGITFDVTEGLTWPEAYDLAMKGDIDALPMIGITDERARHFLFSQPYYYFKRVIVTQDTETSISGIEDLNGMTVAVQRNSSYHSYLLSFPDINLSLYDSVEAALTAVETSLASRSPMAISQAPRKKTLSFPLTRCMNRSRAEVRKNC